MLRLSVALPLLLASSATGVALPSCEDEISANCLGDDADMSNEGIRQCLDALAEKSELCTTYLTMMGACASDIAEGAVCGAAHMDGETMPCLIQRAKPEDLSEGCRASLPKVEVKGLAKFWADGKRQAPSQRLEPWRFAATAKLARPSPRAARPSTAP